MFVLIEEFEVVSELVWNDWVEPFFFPYLPLRFYKVCST